MALGRQAVADCPVAVLLPERPRRHAAPLGLRAHPLPAGPGVRLPRLPLRGEEQAARLAVGHARHVAKGHPGAFGRLPREPGAPLGDVPGGACLPSRHALCKQLQDQPGPYPLRHSRHFPSLSAWRVGQAWEVAALTGSLARGAWSHDRDWVVARP